VRKPIAQDTLAKGPLGHRMPDTSAARGHEERLDRSLWKNGVPNLGITRESESRGVMKRDEARFEATPPAA